MAVPIPTFKLELDDGPKWLSHIEISSKDGLIYFELVNDNGYSKGEARLSITDFNDMADVLTTFKPKG